MARTRFATNMLAVGAHPVRPKGCLTTMAGATHPHFDGFFDPLDFVVARRHPFLRFQSKTVLGEQSPGSLLLNIAPWYGLRSIPCRSSDASSGTCLGWLWSGRSSSRTNGSDSITCSSRRRCRSVRRLAKLSNKQRNFTPRCDLELTSLPVPWILLFVVLKLSTLFAGTLGGKRNPRDSVDVS